MMSSPRPCREVKWGQMQRSDETVITEITVPPTPHLKFMETFNEKKKAEFH